MAAGGVTVCRYIFDGSECSKPASTMRIIPLRTDLPGGDHVAVDLCDRHDRAVTIWLQAQITREADRARR